MYEYKLITFTLGDGEHLVIYSVKMASLFTQNLIHLLVIMYIFANLFFSSVKWSMFVTLVSQPIPVQIQGSKISFSILLTDHDAVFYVY